MRFKLFHLLLFVAAAAVVCFFVNRLIRQRQIIHLKKLATQSHVDWVYLQSELIEEEMYPGPRLQSGLGPEIIDLNEFEDFQKVFPIEDDRFEYQEALAAVNDLVSNRDLFVECGLD